MKTFQRINEDVKEAYDHLMLTEEIDSINNTQFLTEDLVKIVKTHRNNEWSEGLDSNEFDAHLEKLRKEARGGI
jgi:hypothetical protein